MADIRLYLLEVEKDKKEAARIAQGTARRLQNKELKLVDLIESLGEFLNDEDPSIRQRAMSYLAEVIAATPRGLFPLQHRNLLCDFVTSRITDDSAGGVGTFAKTLLALEERGNWDSKRAVAVMTTIIDHTYPLSQFAVQSQRYQVLLLLDLLMSKYRSAIHDMQKVSPDFLPRFIAFFDGEKDPRNLMVVFSVLTVVMTEWDISSQAQDLFDAAFNYFPITFRPPPDDPYKITTQDLKDRLKTCIASTPVFAPYAIPALLDKLDSTSLNTKRDVLSTLCSCVLNYGPRTVSIYAVTLWDALKFEILQVQEEDLAEGSLEILAAIATVLARSSTRDGFINYLKPIVKECNEHLEDAPTKQSEAASRILFAISSSSAGACNFIVSGILPHIFALFQGTNDVAKRRSLVETESRLIQASSKVFGDWRGSPLQQHQENGKDFSIYGRASENVLHQYAKEALDALFTAFVSVSVKSVSYRLILVGAFLQLAKVREVLSDEDITKIVRLFNDVVITEESYGKDEMKTAATNALVEMAHQKPQIVIDSSFPAFLAKLPDNNIGHSENHVTILEAFAKLGAEDQVFSTVVLRLKNKLNAAIHQNASTEYIQSVLAALLFAFSQRSTEFEGRDDFCPYYDDLILPLLTKVSRGLGAEQQHDLTFGLVGKLSNVVLCRQTPAFQEKIASNLYTLASGLPLNEVPPFKVNADVNESRQLILSLYLLASLRRDVALSYDTNEILALLVRTTQSSTLSVGTKAAALQQIGLLINKVVPNSYLKVVLDPILNEPMSLLSAHGINPESTLVLFSIFKALILRNSPLLKDIFPSLIEALSDEKNGIRVAHGFSTLLQPDEILTKGNHCIVSPLHKQKTFAVLVPDIAKGFRSAQPSVKRNYLIALSGILRWLSYSALEPEVTSLSSLLLQTLDIDGEEDIKAGTIDTLNSILAENAKALEEHAGSLITRLLNISSANSNSARVRSKALQCLTFVPAQLRMEVILPYRKQVVKRLTAALDDKRRAVRAEAVRCRSKWIELDEAGVDDDE